MAASERFGVVAPPPANARAETLAWRRAKRARREQAERGPFIAGGRNIGRALRDALAKAS